MMHALQQASLWVLAVCLTVIVVGAIVNALHERREDRDAFDPELLKQFRQNNAKIAMRRAAESQKSEPNNAA